MSKQCAKCTKTVYPTEELKCLDKVWHKACFRCWECGMTLNMKNYKGYDKKPYCNAHYPTTKHTQVADTPEMERLKENTKLQSQVKYHADFENKIKGTKITVADDPETERQKKLTKITSNIEYHGLRQKQQEQENKRPLIEQGDLMPQTQRLPPGAVHDNTDETFSPYTNRSQGSSVVYSSQGKVEQNQGSRRQPGSIHDYDPINDQYGSIAHGHAAQTSYAGQQWSETVPDSRVHRSEMRPGGSSGPARLPPGAVPIMPGSPLHGPKEPSYPQQPPPQQMAPPPQNSSNPLSNAVFKAMYDYDAADEDEVSFRDGDIIINPEPIDDGWMYGTVQRSGQTGMLPSNYVERIQ